MRTDDAEIRSHIPALRVRALKMTRSPADADDLVQDTLLRAHRFAERRTGELRGWLYTIMRTVFINGYWQRKHKAEVHEKAGREAPTSADPVHTAVGEGLLHALAGLTAQRRRLVIGIALEGRSYAEMAAELEIPIGTVMSGYLRARAQLRRALAGVDAGGREPAESPQTDADRIDHVVL